MVRYNTLRTVVDSSHFYITWEHFYITWEHFYISEQFSRRDLNSRACRRRDLNSRAFLVSWWISLHNFTMQVKVNVKVKVKCKWKWDTQGNKNQWLLVNRQTHQRRRNQCIEFDKVKYANKLLDGALFESNSGKENVKYQRRI